MTGSARRCSPPRSGSANAPSGRATRDAARGRPRRWRVPRAKTSLPQPKRTPSARRSAAPTTTVSAARRRSRVSRSAKPRQVGDDEKLSNAVDPSSTASITTTPGRTGRDGRWSNGLPMTIFPVVRLRRNGESRDTAMLYTPNGSARANQRWPHSHAPAQQHHGIDQQPRFDPGQRCRVRAGQFHPDEGEQTQRRRPISPAFGIGQPRPAKPFWGDPPQQQVHRAHRRDHPPHRSERQRQRDQSDPQQHVERAQQRVGSAFADPTPRPAPPTPRKPAPARRPSSASPGRRPAWSAPPATGGPA